MRRGVTIPLWALLSGSLVLFVTGTWLLGWFLSPILVINWTGSMAEGIYTRSHDAAARGSLVMFCPSKEAIAREKSLGSAPAAGPCPSGSIMFLKRVAAVAGDEVILQAKGMVVNGQLVPGSHAIGDPRLRVLQSIKHGRYRVPAGHVWVISDSPGGYDSRYYGPVQPKSTVVPMLLWKGPDK